MTAPPTMQWGHPQPHSGEGDEAMRRSGAYDHDPRAGGRQSEGRSG
jgi:hypothetical protein